MTVIHDGRCAGCEQEDWFNDPKSDLSAACPSVVNHTCRKKGPRTRKGVLKAIEKAAHELYHSFSAKMPGGDYRSEQEISALLWRLAND